MLLRFEALLNISRQQLLDGTKVECTPLHECTRARDSSEDSKVDWFHMRSRTSRTSRSTTTITSGSNVLATILQ